MFTLAGLFGLSGGELLLIFLAILLLFGAKRLPELTRSLGRSLTEFKKGMTEDEPSAKADAQKPEQKPESKPPPAA